jgi:uncharacterized membrane protein YkvA (DUF1232 family)
MRARRIDPNRYTDPGVLQGIVQQVRLAWRLLNDPRVPMRLKALVPAAVLYIFSPVDFLPDFILGLGQLDDLGIILAALTLFVRLVPKAIVAEHQAAIDGRAPDAGWASDRRDSVIDAEYTVDDGRRGAPRR